MPDGPCEAQYRHGLHVPESVSFGCKTTTVRTSVASGFQFSTSLAT